MTPCMILQSLSDCHQSGHQRIGAVLSCWMHYQMFLRAPASTAPAAPMVKIKCRVNNQITTIEAPSTALWREVHWQLLRKLHLDNDDVEIRHQGQPVHMAQQVPGGDVHRHIPVDVTVLRRAAGTRSRSRSRPRTAAATMVTRGV